MGLQVRMGMGDHIPLFFAAICFFFLTTLPQSHPQPQPQPQPHDNKFSECNRPYNCGDLSNSNIYYPFWGYNRPHYCGTTDGFKLNCEGNQHTSIQIGSQNFSVLEIDATSYTMTMTIYDDVCSPLFASISLSPFFRYSETVHNITIFYDCHSGKLIVENTFNCSDDGKLNAFYVDANDALFQRLPGLHDCKNQIKVPALREPRSGAGLEALNQAVAGGFEVKYIVPEGQECSRCLESKGACGTNDADIYQFSCHCPDGSDALQCRLGNPSSWKKKAIIGVTSAAIGGILICITICCFRCKPLSRRENFWLTKNSNQDIEAFLKNHGALALRRYKFSDVKKMTNSFKVKLGQGGFGAVFKGQLLTGCPVAVKMLNLSKENGQEFINEVASISRTSHVNVVTLLGFCLEGSKRALIYEFMPNGSLEKFIYKKAPETTLSLSWDKLYQIAIGIARGLEYLHKGCNTRILHFDIKPHNILLDENFCPKISDFGLAKLCPKKESIISMSDARGTIGYVAPEVWNRHFGRVSHKSDVYSYGMMLLEMVGGRKNINADASRTSEIYFPHWVYKRLELGTNDLGLDEVMAIEENNIAKRMTMVGLWCVQTIPNDRPTMGRVIEMLEGSMNSLEMPPKPVLSSPTRSVVESSTTSN